jgi:hypothetical protein
MFISTKNACVIKRFKDQVNLSETSLLEDSGTCLHNSIAYSVLQNIVSATNKTDHQFSKLAGGSMPKASYIGLGL